MKNIQTLIKITLALGCVTLLMAFGDFLALNDIWHDYVSKEVIETYSANVSKVLPDWSATKLEWNMVRASGLISFIYFFFSLSTLVICLKFLKKKVK